MILGCTIDVDVRSRENVACAGSRGVGELRLIGRGAHSGNPGRPLGVTTVVRTWREAGPPRPGRRVPGGVGYSPWYAGRPAGGNDCLQSRIQPVVEDEELLGRRR
jgi:hypothetical protein